MSYLRYLCLLTYSDVQHIVFSVLICLSSSCVPYAVRFSGLSFFIAPSIFSNVYLQFFFFEDVSTYFYFYFKMFKFNRDKGGRHSGNNNMKQSH